MAEVKATYLGNGRTQLSIGQRTCVMEDDLDVGKQREHLCPTEMLAAAVAGWIILTLTAVAAHKGIQLEKIEVSTSMDLDLATGNKTQTAFRSRIAIEGHLTQRERTILLNSAHHCDIHKIIRGEVTMGNELRVSENPWAFEFFVRSDMIIV